MMRPLTLIPPLIILGILIGGIFFAYILTHPPTPKVVVTIQEGATVSDINKILRGKGVLTEDLPQLLEGYLFPDTYEFFIPSDAAVVEAKFAENFNQKVRTIVPVGSSEKDLREILTKASLIEKEVPDLSDRKIVAGIMVKRLENNIPLQIDASLCYIKDPPCFPIIESDKKADSPFNTYLHKGLPLHPISNPGVDAVLAALNPVATPYWYYLSDPKSKKTIFSRTLDEHNDNIVKYLNTAN